MFGFPERYCHLVASEIHGDDAFVVIETGSDGRSYLYGVACVRQEGRWVETGSSNGGGWLSGPDPSIGRLAHFDEAPKNADAVRLVCDGATREVLVKDGGFLAMWWKIPCPSLAAWPRVVAFRQNGNWVQR